VRVLARRGVSPDTVSASQVPVGALAAVIMRRRPRTALALIVVAVLLDALDGTLARATGQATARGALVDQLCDHARELLVAAAITRAAGTSWRWAALYALLYPASNAALAAPTAPGARCRWRSSRSSRYTRRPCGSSGADRRGMRAGTR
jgi:phosphatidylglycerophosphate synthase